MDHLDHRNEKQTLHIIQKHFARKKSRKQLEAFYRERDTQAPDRITDKHLIHVVDAVTIIIMGKTEVDNCVEQRLHHTKADR
jgi:hypothetical protein